MAAAASISNEQVLIIGSESDSASDLSDQTSDLAGVNYIKSASAQTLNDEVQFSVMETGELVEYMKENITDISSIIEEDFTITRLLLTHFQWDRQKLLEKFYDRDKAALFKEAGIVTAAQSLAALDDLANSNEFSDALQQLPETSQPAAPGDNHEQTTIAKARSKQAQLLQPAQVPECGICLMPAESSDEGFKLSCCHRFCCECWKSYLSHSILNEGLAQNITCPAYQCRVPVGDGAVLELITDYDVRLRYQHLITNSFVSCNRKLRWCPAAGCNRVIKADAIARQVSCTCGEKFCFHCGDQWHSPVRCDWMKYWRNKISNDSPTTEWLASNTKECPKCSATIEKDGGCNHMVCRKDNCMYEFCWVCLGPWQEHGQNAWYNCNRFHEKTSKDARSAMDKSRASMLRFLHYFNRYSNHQQSMKFEAELYNKVNSRIQELTEGQGQAWNEVKFLKSACDILSKARQLLMITYVFAYFVIQNNQSIIFEDNQRDLELATEQLSEYLERDIFKKGVEGMKQKVNDKSNYCLRRCAVLTSHVQEGYESAWWDLCLERRKTV